VVTIPYTKDAVVWNMSPFNLADIFYPEDGGSRILLNVRTYEGVLISPSPYQEETKLHRPIRDLFNVLPTKLNKLLSPLL
jgi:hypothetical protein